MRHTDRSIVKALVSRSALARKDDPVALVAFADVTERLWTEGHLTEYHWNAPSRLRARARMITADLAIALLASRDGSSRRTSGYWVTASVATEWLRSG